MARVERDGGSALEGVRVAVHESEFGAWRGYFFCAARERFRVGEILRLAMTDGRRRTAVVYGTEAVAGHQLWVVDLVGADPPSRASVQPAEQESGSG